MNYITFKSAIKLFFITSICTVAVFSQTQSTFAVLNEIQVDNPGSDNINCEYVEVRGDAGTSVPGNMYLVEVEGDGGGAGTVDFVQDLSTFSFGANGLITIVGDSPLPFHKQNFNKKSIFSDNGIPVGPCGNRDYTVDGTTLIEDSSISFENATISFLLLSSTGAGITVGTDLDTDNNGTIDNLPTGLTIIDAVGWTDGGVSDFVYGGVNITPSTGTPDAATRNFNNVTPLAVSAWFADNIVGSIDSVLYNQTNLFGGYRIDFITPGRQNLAPTAANAIISGRARTDNGQGIKHVVVMLSGGTLQEPIYTITNQFGNYQFTDITVGENYILQVISNRHIFDNPIRNINLDDNIRNVDFIIN